MSTDLNANEKCPACGQPLVAGAKFCRACGAPASQPARPNETACPSCGAQHNAGAKFCKHCGFRFEAAQPASPKDSMAAPGAEPQAVKSQESLPVTEGTSPATGKSAESEARDVPPRVCPSCGTRQAAAKAFCRSCGARLVPVETKVSVPAPPGNSAAGSIAAPAMISDKEVPSIVRCGACGAEVPAGKKFCRSCGAPVGSTVRPAVVAPSVIPVSTKPSAPSVAMPPTLRVTAQPAPPKARIAAARPAPSTSMPGQRRTALVVVLIVACVALLGGGGFLAYRHFKASRQATQNGNATSQAPASATQTGPSQGASSPATQATPPSIAPAQTREMPSPAASSSSRRRTPTFHAMPSTPSSNPGGEGLGEAGGIAGPAVQAPGNSSAGIAAPATNPSGQAAAGVAGSANANSSAGTTAPANQFSVTPSAPPATPQAVQPAIPSSGTLTWSGHLGKNALVTIQGHSASSGSLQGQLPGVPVIIQVDPSDVGVAEAPGPQNSWKRVVLRSNKSRNIVVRIEWRRLQY